MDSSRPRRRLWHIEGARTLRSLRGATIIAAFAVGIGLLIMLFGEPYQVRLAVAAYINLILVLGLQIFMGNANVANLAHPGFMGLGAYLTSIFAVPLVIKKTLIPNAPFGLGEVQLGIVPSFVAAVSITGIIAALDRALSCPALGDRGDDPDSRHPGHHPRRLRALGRPVPGHPGVLRHTEGGGIETMMVATALVILVARLFKDSRIGVQLRASATNMLAAEAMGVNIRALRLIAWVLGGVVCGIAGALYAYYLGTVNARAFYFHAAFLTLAMHILGGMRSVTGAVVGVVLISVAMELIRHLESGPVILGAQLPDLFGLGSLMLGVIIVLVMCLRSDGLMGGLELDEVLDRYWKRWRRGG